MALKIELSKESHIQSGLVLITAWRVKMNCNLVLQILQPGRGSKRNLFYDIFATSKCFYYFNIKTWLSFNICLKCRQWRLATNVFMFKLLQKHFYNWVKLWSSKIDSSLKKTFPITNRFKINQKFRKTKQNKH